jgi:hypothetical protein
MARQQKQKDKEKVQWSHQEIGLLRKHYPDVVSVAVAKKLENAIEAADMKKSLFGQGIRRQPPGYKQPSAESKPKSKSKKRDKSFFDFFIAALVAVLFAILFYGVLHKIQVWPSWSLSGTGGGTRLDRLTEVPLCRIESCRALGSPWRYTTVTCQIFARAKDGKTQQLAGLVARNDIKIKDIVRSVIAQARLHQLTDPKLEFITSQVGEKMEQIVGNGTIAKILIPQWSVDL